MLSTFPEVNNNHGAVIETTIVIFLNCSNFVSPLLLSGGRSQEKKREKTKNKQRTNKTKIIKVGGWFSLSFFFLVFLFSFFFQNFFFSSCVDHDISCETQLLELVSLNSVGHPVL